MTIKADHKRGDLVPSKTQLKKLTKERASQPTAQKVTDLEVDIRNGNDSGGVMARHLS